MKQMQLERRDQVALICAGLVVVLVVFMAFYLPVGPIRKYRDAQRELESNRQELQMWQMQKQEQLARLESQQEFQQRLAARPQSFDFISFVDQVLRETDLKQRAELSSSRERASTATQPMVDLELRGISLEELVNFLHRIHSSGNLVAVYELKYIRPTKELQGLDLNMTLVTVRA